MRQYGASVPVNPTTGESVKVRYTKWDGTPHWTCSAVYLGEDAFGRWVGQPRGTVVERPGTRFVSPWHVVVLLPNDRYTAGFYESSVAIGYTGPGSGVSIYVDITTLPTWTRAEEVVVVTMVDLDLDVVRQLDGTTFVDDEDEFADHQVAMSYPADVIAAAERSSAHVLEAIKANVEPYATVGPAWLERFIASRL